VHEGESEQSQGDEDEDLDNDGKYASVSAVFVAQSPAFAVPCECWHVPHHCSQVRLIVFSSCNSSLSALATFELP